MKKILLLTTGGTIASVKSDEGLTPKMTAEELVSFLPKASNYRVNHKILMNIDSTNMQPEYWVKIAETIHQNYHEYDGFVVTHGTDTMAYTSAALSYMMQNLGKPIVLTGSQVPISFGKTDARKNINDALHFACEDVGGVYIVFDGKVILGTRAVKIRTKSYDAFESINHPYVAQIVGSEVRYNLEKPIPKDEKMKLDTSLCPNVFLLKLYPGTDPFIFDYLKQHYKGVIIESFGSGGVPFQERNLLPKVKELCDAGIAVVITTQCLEEGENVSLYEVGRKVNQNTVILSGDMNTEAIVPKLMWTLGKTNDLLKVKKWMETPIVQDITNNFDQESWD